MSHLSAFTHSIAPSISGDFDVTWIIRLIFGALLSVNIYFLQKVARVFENTVDTVRLHQQAIAQLQRIGEVVLADMLVESAGSPDIGRRKNDAMLRILLSDLQTSSRLLGGGHISSRES